MGRSPTKNPAPAGTTGNSRHTMNEMAHQSLGDLSARVTAMEELAMHQDRVIQQLHEVVLQQDRRLASVEANLARLTRQLRTFYESLDDPPPPDEKPPHY